MKATGIANTNIALIKYWGNRNHQLSLPYNSSISMTLDGMHTVTSVEFSKSFKNEVIINGIQAKSEEQQRVIDHITLIKKKLNIDVLLNAKVVSNNNFPKRAGIASSASAFAALTIAAVKALEKELTSQELSILARLGSGSASRSIFGGFVEWEKGEAEDGSDSYSTVLAEKEHWPELTMIVTIVNPQEKKIGSRDGMQHTVRSSSFYSAWRATIEQDLQQSRNAIYTKNFTELGTVVENNAFKMHSLMHTSIPPLIYWEPETIRMIKQVLNLRQEGIECYITMDAGPQVKILCLQKNVETILGKLSQFKEMHQYYVCQPGSGAQITDVHLF